MDIQLTLSQVSEHLRITEDAITKMVKYDEIPHRKRGKTPYFTQSEVDAWASRRLLAQAMKHLQPEHTSSTLMDVKHPPHDALLPSLITPERIELNLSAKTRRSVLSKMIDLAAMTDLVYDPPDLLRQVTEREAVCSTAMPGGLALLHPHHQSPYVISEPFIVLGRTVPIFFGAVEDKATDLFCLICCGEHMRHLHVLARLCMMIHDTPLATELRKAETSEEACEAFYRNELIILNKLK